MSTLDRWLELDATDRPRLGSLEPLAPGDPAYHRDDLVLYWPLVGATAWTARQDIRPQGSISTR